MNRKLRLKKEPLTALGQDDLLAVAAGFVDTTGLLGSIATNCPNGCSCVCSVAAPCCNTYACATYGCTNDCATGVCATAACVRTVLC